MKETVIIWRCRFTLFWCFWLGGKEINERYIAMTTNLSTGFSMLIWDNHQVSDGAIKHKVVKCFAKLIWKYRKWKYSMVPETKSNSSCSYTAFFGMKTKKATHKSYTLLVFGITADFLSLDFDTIKLLASNCPIEQTVTNLAKLKFEICICQYRNANHTYFKLSKTFAITHKCPCLTNWFGAVCLLNYMVLILDLDGRCYCWLVMKDIGVC